MRQLHRLSLVAFLALLVAMPAYAQKITGTIRGTVTDPTGAIIAGAKVTVKNEDTGLTRSSTTSSAGLFSVAELPGGRCRVEVEHPGFKAEGRSKVTLNVADTRAVDIQLATGDISEVVNVEVPAGAVKTVGGDISRLRTGTHVRGPPL